LAQLIAADATAAGTRLDQIVTFNAPAIAADFAELFQPARADRVIHYITNGDPVSMAGEQFLTGVWRRATFDDLDLGNNHVLPVLNNRIVIGQPDPTPDLVRLRPTDLMFEEEFPTVDWLNHPFYFHTDQDYFLVVAAMQLVTESVESLQPFSDLPSQLMFRSTVEAKRREIGAVWHDIQSEVTHVIDSLNCDSGDSQVTIPEIRVDLRGVLTIQATQRRRAGLAAIALRNCWIWASMVDLTVTTWWPRAMWAC